MIFNFISDNTDTIQIQEEKETPAYGETIAANEFCETNKLKIILDPIPHIIV